MADATESRLEVSPAIRRARRRVRLDFDLVHVMTWAVLTSLAIAALSTRLPWWALALIGIGSALLAFLALRGRVASRWIRDGIRFLRRRRRPIDSLAGETMDVEGAGVRTGDGYVLVAAIELAPVLAETRLHGDRAITNGTVPLELLASMMTQYGIEVDIDVVSTGCRVPEGPAFRASYAQSIRFYSAMAQRSTWLLLRMDMQRSLDGIVGRGPSKVAAPRALAAAARRLEQRLHERQLRARVLTAEELSALDEALLPGRLDESSESWRQVRFGPKFSTSYIVDPLQLSTAVLDRLWSVDSDATTVALQLRKGPRGQVQISGLVRYETAVVSPESRDPALLHVAGEQRGLLQVTRAGGASSVRALPAAALGRLDAVDIPIGPAGPVWGRSGDDAIALPLHDATPVPETLQIEFRTALAIAQLVLLRAVGAGASVEVRTARPDAWVDLRNTIAEPRRFSIAAGNDAQPHADITVYDGIEVVAVPSRTMLVLGPAEGSQLSSPDVIVAGARADAVQVIVRGNTAMVIDLAPTSEELRYIGAVHARPVPPPAREAPPRPVAPPAPRGRDVGSEVRGEAQLRPPLRHRRDDEGDEVVRRVPRQRAAEPAPSGVASPGAPRRRREAVPAEPPRRQVQPGQPLSDGAVPGESAARRRIDPAAEPEVRRRRRRD